MKKMSLLLAIAMLMTSFMLPVGVSAQTAECINETFENYADNTALFKSWQNKSDHTKEVDALGTIDGRGNVLKLETLGTNDTNGKKTTTLRRAIGYIINEGKMEISFSMMHDYNMGGTTNDRNMTSRIDIMGTDRNYESWLPLLTINGAAHDLYVGDAKNAETDKVMNVVSGIWYDVKIIYDIATQDYELTITDGTTPVTKTGTYDTQYGNLLPTDTGVRAIRCATLGSWDDMSTVDGHGTMYLDNIYVGRSVYINENFENYTSSENLLQTWQNKSDHTKTVNALGTVDGRGNVLKLETLGTNDTNGKKTTTLRRAIGGVVNEGKMEISFSMMHDYNMGGTANDRNMTSRIDIMGTDRNYESWLPLLTINGAAHDLYVGDAKNAETDKVMNVVSGTWYDVKIIYDIATQDYELTITDGTTPVTKTGTYDTQYGNLLPTDTGIRAIRCATLGSWNDMSTVDGHGTMYLDNIKVKEGAVVSDNPEPPAEPDTPDSNPVIFKDNFNNYADANALMGVWLPREGSKEAGSVSLGTGEDDTKAYKISRKNSGSSNIDRTETWLDNEGITSGVFKTTFKMMSDYTDASEGTTAKMQTVVSFVDKDLNRYIPVIFVDDGKIYSGVTAGNAANYLCESVSGAWYDVEVVFDAGDMSYDVSVTDGSSVYTIENIKGFDCAGATYNNITIDDIGKLRVELWGGTVGYGSTTIDDVNVVYSTNAIDVHAEDLSFENTDGEKSAYAATVSASTEKISIDFGTMMNEASLKDSSVVLMNITDDEAVEYEPELNGSVYTLNLPKLLKPGKNYSLTITTDVENMNNEPAESEVIFTFASDGGECNISFNSFAIGANSEPTVEEILAANTAKVKMNVLNSTGIDKDLLIIITYFNGSELVDVVYEDCDVPYADYVNGIFEKDITLKSGIAADSISVFAWNKFSEMVPYTKHIVIPAQGN